MTSTISIALDLDDRASVTSGLTAQDARILDFERSWWRFGGAKEEAIREQFDMSATRYYQLLNQLIDRPPALEADPVLVRRLRRLRQTRQEARSARSRLGLPD
jgi:Protein of unknown function (DUF3263)